MLKKEDIKLNKVLVFPVKPTKEDERTHLVFEIYLIQNDFIAINGYYTAYDETRMSFHRKIRVLPIADIEYTGELEHQIILTIDEYRHNIMLYNIIKESIISPTESKLATFISSENLVVVDAYSKKNNSLEDYNVLWYTDDIAMVYCIRPTPDLKIFAIHNNALLESPEYFDVNPDYKLASLSLDDIDMSIIDTDTMFDSPNHYTKTRWYQYAKNFEQWTNIADELKVICVNLYVANKMCSIGLNKIHLYNSFKEENISTCINLNTGTIKENCQNIIAQLIEISVSNAMAASGLNSTYVKNYISSDIDVLINSIPAAIYSGLIFK